MVIALLSPIWELFKLFRCSVHNHNNQQHCFSLSFCWIWKGMLIKKQNMFQHFFITYQINSHDEMENFQWRTNRFY
jgi:hypothetical protein